MATAATEMQAQGAKAPGNRGGIGSDIAAEIVYCGSMQKNVFPRPNLEENFGKYLVFTKVLGSIEKKYCPRYKICTIFVSGEKKFFYRPKRVI